MHENDIGVLRLRSKVIQCQCVHACGVVHRAHQGPGVGAREAEVGFVHAGFFAGVKDAEDAGVRREAQEWKEVLHDAHARVVGEDEAFV